MPNEADGVFVAVRASDLEDLESHAVVLEAAVESLANALRNLTDRVEAIGMSRSPMGASAEAADMARRIRST